MRWLMKAISFVLILTILCGISSGCGKDQSPTTQELMEKYGNESYVYVPKDEMPMIYLYGQEDEELRNKITYYNAGHRGQTNKQLRYLLCNDLTIEQFGLKMHTQMMSGGEPDMILTRQSEMFSDINKVIASGALAAWDEYEANWDHNLYYEKMLDGVYSPDGKHYLIPINVDMQFIVTTKSTLEQYGLTEDDFSDFTKTTETLYHLWQTVGSDIYPSMSYPDFTQVLSDILDYEARQTAMLQGSNWETLLKWKEIFCVLQKRIEQSSLLPKSTNMEYIMDGKILVEFADIDMLNSMLSDYKRLMSEKNNDPVDTDNMTPNFFPPKESDEKDLFFEEVFSDLIFIPLYNDEGKIIGEVDAYAIMSSQAKGKEAITDFMKWLVEGKYYVPELGGGELSLHIPHINKTSTINEFWGFYAQGYVKGIFTGDIIHKIIDDKEWSLCVPNSVRTKYHDIIINYLYSPETADWQELERSINIYLSE